MSALFGKLSLSQMELAHMFIQGSKSLEEKREFLNNINVFPVADGDTGANMAFTVKSVRQVLEKTEFESLEELGKSISSTALINSRGNSGTVLSQYFKGFCSVFKDNESLGITGLAKCFIEGNNSAKEAFLNPQKGTILDIMDTAAVVALEGKHASIAELLQEILTQTKLSLENTKNILPQMQSAKVVDAGAAGFVLILEGFLSSFTGSKVEKILSEQELCAEAHEVHIYQFEEKELKYKYCTECVLESDYINVESLEKQLENLGDSLQIVQAENLLKIHIHTNYPEKVREICGAGTNIINFKADDMVAMQHDFAQKQSNGNLTDILIVTDSSADLPTEIFEKYPIKVLQIPVYDTNTLENIELNYIDFYRKMETDSSFSPKTSKINEQAFIQAFAEGLKNYKRVLCIPISKELSGTYESAVQAKKVLKSDNITVFESGTSSSGITVLIKEFFKELECMGDYDLAIKKISGIKQKLEVYFVVDDVKYLERGGRISKNKAKLAQILNIQPVLALKNGKIVEDKKLFFAKNNFKKVDALLDKIRARSGGFGLGEFYLLYAGKEGEESIEILRQKILSKTKLNSAKIKILELNFVIGTHTGPGTIGVVML